MPLNFALATATPVPFGRGQADLAPAPDAVLGGCGMRIHGPDATRSTALALPAPRSCVTGLPRLNAQGNDGAAQTAADGSLSMKASPASLSVHDLVAQMRAAG